MCCGAKRVQARTNTAQTMRQTGTTAIMARALNADPAQTVFEYTGKTALTVVSPTTGNRYRFEKTGAQLPVDARDQATLLYVPNLRPVRAARG